MTFEQSIFANETLVKYSGIFIGIISPYIPQTVPNARRPSIEYSPFPVIFLLFHNVLLHNGSGLPGSYLEFSHLRLAGLADENSASS